MNYLRVFCCLLLFLFIPNFANASSDIREYIPKEIVDEFKLKDFEGVDPSKMMDSVSFNDLISFLQKKFHEFLPEFTRLVSSVLLLVFLFVLIEQFALSGNYKMVIVCVANLSMLLLLYQYFSRSLEMIEDGIETIRIFCEATIPSVTALLVAGGRSFGATVFSYGITLSTSLISGINAAINYPLLRIYLAIGSCGTMWDGIKVNSLTESIGKFIKWLLGIVFSIFTLTLSLQSVLSKSADSMAQKALSAAASSVPFMGSILSQSVNGMFSLFAGSKNMIATIGIIAIFAIFSGPVIAVALQAVALFIAKTLAGIFSQNSSIQILKTFLETYQLMLGLFLVSVLMCAICFLMICFGIA